SRATPDFFTRATKALYEPLPFSRRAAFKRTIQSWRNSFFLSRRLAKACLPACTNDSLAARSFLLRPWRYPLARFRTFLRRFCEMTPPLTRGIARYVRLFAQKAASDALVKGKGSRALFDALGAAALLSIEMVVA